MPNPDLPTVVSDYFDRMDGDDKTSVVDLFATDGQVTDDGASYHGPEEIAGWLAADASAYDTTSTRLSAERTDESTVVLVRVEGNFPGGVVDLRHRFTLDAGEHIHDLTISAVGSS